MYQKQNVSKTIDTSQIEENIVNSLVFPFPFSKLFYTNKAHEHITLVKGTKTKQE
jgi:hypothetical protein